MKLNILGAASLDRFSQELQRGFEQVGAPDNLFELYQIHAAPHSLTDDLQIISTFKQSKKNKLLLIHRPDELLLNSELTKFIAEENDLKIILLGDLTLNIPFWDKLRSHIQVIPHPYFSLNLPEKSPKYSVGSFTSWGEMRKVEHYLGLMNELLQLPVADQIQAKIGGTHLERSLVLNPKIEITETPFIPHFNVQLYHLMGAKRVGESSGSLHTGISIPVIFEANGIERTEGVRVIKIAADENLAMINYRDAALEIASLIEKHQIEEVLKFNLKQAQSNTAINFATRAIEFFSASTC
jgi:hypothetical protein